MVATAPNNCFRRGRHFDGGTADRIILQAAGGGGTIDKTSSYCKVVVVFTPKASTGTQIWIDCSRLSTNNRGWEIGYHAGDGTLIFACANDSSSTQYFAFKGSKSLTVGRTYCIIFTYIAGSVATITVETLGTNGETLTSEALSITTSGTDLGIADSSGQGTFLGEYSANGLISNKISDTGFKGTGWLGGAGGNPTNGVFHYLRIERTTAGVADAEFLFNEAAAATTPVDETGNCTGIALGAVAPAVLAAEFTVTEFSSGDPVGDGSDYDAGTLDTDDTVVIVIENTGDSVGLIETITDAGGDLGYTSGHAVPRWIYPGSALALTFTQAGSGGTGGATIAAFADDWLSDSGSDGDFVISLTYALPSTGDPAVDLRTRTRRSLREFRGRSVA